MTVALAADHAGYDMKQLLAAALSGDGHTIIDLGTNSREPVDYPDYALAIGAAINGRKAERGILVCGSGVGACVAANKIRGIRAGTCHDTYSGHQGVEHDDMNVLCLGARVIGSAPALEICRAFLAARFSNEERHARRVAKTRAIEQNQG
ncbi:MAG TPA: RpiB/LacA/LacB family sugar-phosphate isomerase [Bacteroidota bacterium]|nr:RpiB/LacA/LacB family sugar-phosphate isomerase [Bacteroidota bacterium]